MKRTVYYDGGALAYEICYKKVKNITFRVAADLSVRVTAARQYTPEDIDGYVRGKLPWILRAQRDLAHRAAERAQYGLYNQLQDGGYLYLLGEKIPIKAQKTASGAAVLQEGTLYLANCDEALWPKQVEQFYRRQSIIIFEAINESLYPHLAQFGLPRATIGVRKMTASWGRCHVSKKHIVLNTQLVRAPKACIISVLTHEYAHLAYPDHSRRFYDLLYRLLPEYDQLTQQLNLCIELSK